MQENKEQPETVSKDAGSTNKKTRGPITKLWDWYMSLWYEEIPVGRDAQAEMARRIDSVRSETNHSVSMLTRLWNWYTSIWFEEENRK